MLSCLQLGEDGQQACDKVCRTAQEGTVPTRQAVDVPLYSSRRKVVVLLFQTHAFVLQTSDVHAAIFVVRISPCWSRNGRPAIMNAQGVWQHSSSCLCCKWLWHITIENWDWVGDCDQLVRHLHGARLLQISRDFCEGAQLSYTWRWGGGSSLCTSVPSFNKKADMYMRPKTFPLSFGESLHELCSPTAAELPGTPP